MVFSDPVYLTTIQMATIEMQFSYTSSLNELCLDKSSIDEEHITICGNLPESNLTLVTQRSKESPTNRKMSPPQIDRVAQLILQEHQCYPDPV